MEWAGVSRLL